MAEEHDSFAARSLPAGARRPPLSSGSVRPYIADAARKGGYGDKWASE